MRRLPDRLLIAVVLSCAICLVVGLVSSWAPYEDLNHWTYDFLVNHGIYAKPSPQVVLVDFDDKTFEKIQKYPIPRSVIAQVIEEIGQAKPRVIGLDMFLSEPRDAAEDDAMQRALTSAGNVILATQAGTGQVPAVLPLPVFCQPEDRDVPTGFCKEGQPGAFGIAAINMPWDSDGFVRTMETLAYGKNQRRVESFPVMMAQLFLAQDPAVQDCKTCILTQKNKYSARFNGHRVPYGNWKTQTVLIGHWGPNLVTTVSAWEVLSGGAGPDTFKDKLVLIGQGSDAARDTHFTPIFRVSQPDGKRERIGGTAVHAAAIQTLLNGEAIQPTAQWIEWVVNALVVAVAIYLVMHLRLRGGLPAILGMLVGIYAVAQLLFTFGHVWYQFLATGIATAAALPAGLAYQYLQEKLLHTESQKQREQLMDMFSRYVDPEVAHTIWLRRDQLSLSGEEKVATVLFTDIRGFTAMTAGKPSKTVLRWLNGYFTEMDELIRAHGGFLNKFIGDGLLIVFGVPLSHGLKQDAIAAVETSFAMLQRLEEMNRNRKANDDCPELHIGIGIHTGPLTCGSVGSAKRLEYSVIGETVNLSSRLESLNKEYHSEIILTQQTYDLVKDRFPELYPMGSTPVRGFDEPVPIYTAKTRAGERESVSRAGMEKAEVTA